MGFFGSSCSAAITKNFGALTMSITSTARKATTLFLSFMFFDNNCTLEHLAGIVVFISALTAKSLRRKNKRRTSVGLGQNRRIRMTDLENGTSPVQTASFDSSDLASSSIGSLGQDLLKNTSQRRTPRRNNHRDGSPSRRAVRDTKASPTRHYNV